MVGAHRPEASDRRRGVRRHQAAAHALDAADRLVGDRVDGADLGRGPRDPVGGALGPERAPVVHEQRRRALRLREQDQQHVDVLARVVDDGQEAGRPGRVRVLGVPAEVVRPLARELEALVVDLALDRVGVGQPVVLGAVLPARRDLLEDLHRLALPRPAQQPDALVVDHEHRRRLGVVGARGGAAGDVQERGAELGLAAGLVQRPVVHHRARGPGAGDEDRLLQRRERRGLVGALVAHVAGLQRDALRDPSRAAVLQAGHHRIAEQVLQRGRAGAVVPVVSGAGPSAVVLTSPGAPARRGRSGRCRARRSRRATCRGARSP